MLNSTQSKNQVIILDRINKGLSQKKSRLSAQYHFVKEDVSRVIRSVNRYNSSPSFGGSSFSQKEPSLTKKSRLSAALKSVLMTVQHPLFDVSFVEREGDDDEDQRRGERLDTVFRSFP